MRRQFGDSHDGVAGVVAGTALENRRGDDRPRPGGDHHLVGGELLAGVGMQQVAPVVLNWSEAGVLFVHIDVGRGTAIVLAADRDGIDAPENPGDDVVPAHPLDAGVNAVARRVADRLGDLGRVHEHLGRDASDVEAGSAEGALLAHRHPLVGEAVIENAVARTGSNDRDVVGLHALTPFRMTRGRRHRGRAGGRPASRPVPDRRPRAAAPTTGTRRVWRRPPG